MNVNLADSLLQLMTQYDYRPIIKHVYDFYNLALFKYIQQSQAYKVSTFHLMTHRETGEYSIAAKRNI